MQQLAAAVLQNVGLPADSNLVLLYEDPGAYEPSAGANVLRHLGAFMLSLTTGGLLC